MLRPSCFSRASGGLRGSIQELLDGACNGHAKLALILLPRQRMQDRTPQSHSAVHLAESVHQMKHRLFLDVVISQSAAVLELHA